MFARIGRLACDLRASRRLDQASDCWGEMARFAPAPLQMLRRCAAAGFRLDGSPVRLHPVVF